MKFFGSLFRIISSMYYRLRYKALSAQNSLLYKIHVSGSKDSKILLTESHMVKTNITIHGHENQIILKSCGIYHLGNIAIEGNNNILEINEGCALSNINIVIRGNGCNVKIGSKTTSNGTSLYCIGDKNSIIIGKDCMFAANTEIWSSDTHTIINSETGQPLNIKRQSVLIGNHVWLAEHAKILKGTNISDNCILGMSSILTKDTEPNSIYVGIPAKKIKDGINWKREFETRTGIMTNS